jgi:cell division protease FtsH
MGTFADDGVPTATTPTPELRDLRRLVERAVRHTVEVARADERPTLGRRLREFVGPLDEAPVVSDTWPLYDHVNVQRALDAWLEEPGREHELVGIAGFQHMEFGIAELFQVQHRHSPLRLGGLATVNLPSGPDGEALRCISTGLVLVTDPDGARLVVLLRIEEHMDRRVQVQILCRDTARAEAAAARLRELVIERNVYRGQVVSFGKDIFGHGRGESLLTFETRPHVPREHLVLPEEVLGQVRRQVITVAQHRDALRAGGQHLRRGVLLYGPPGTGKTHTVRHLMGLLPDTTVLLISGPAVVLVGEACAIARNLQPAMVVVEDVDLIAMDRDMAEAAQPMLFELMNQMDGLAAEADIVFVLTTNRADMLEQALAARPGRIDQAVEMELPDAAARRALVELYRGALGWEVGEPTLEAAIGRTAGTTASFTKEMLRRAALVSLERDPGQSAPTITDADLVAGLDELLDSRNRMTRRALGAGHDDGQASPRPPVRPAAPGSAP